MNWETFPFPSPRLLRKLRFVDLVNVLSAYLYVHHVYAWWPRRSGKGDGSPRTVAKVGYKPPYGFGELNSGLLQEKQEFLTDNPSLQPFPDYYFLNHTFLYIL